MLAPGLHIINAAGLLTGTSDAFAAVHVKAPAAAYAARTQGAQAVVISAVGIEPVGIKADTAFARWRRDAEDTATAAQVTILRAGLVLGHTSYGGSSLIRALAALPFVAPVIGDGAQRFNPVQARDLAAVVLECLRHPPGPGQWQAGGPETISQIGLIQATQSWLGLPKRPVLRLPIGVARAMGPIGDALRLGPISATSVAQLQSGVLASRSPLLAKISIQPRPFAVLANARPAGTQDLWQARLYLLKPLIRLTLAALWLWSGGLGIAAAPRAIPARCARAA